MANPRKFSEKIALHTQKQAEQTVAFETVLKLVSSTTQQATKQHGQPSQSHLAQPSFGAYRGRSLPNVNQMASGTVDLQSALSSLENMKQNLNGQPPPDKYSRHRNQQTQKKFSLDRHRDCSPYGSVYLSPPETNWRRSSSDSALHASVQASAAPDSILTGSSSMLMNRQSDVTMLPSGQSLPMDTGQFWVNSKDGRPRSCEVPGISIYPSPDQGSASSNVPISNNTGSLPDLANLNFPPPLATPLDVETQNDLQEQLQQQHLQRVMRNVLPCYVTPVNMAIPSDQHQPPSGMDGTQRQMISVPPVVLQGSNHFLLRGGGTGGTVLSQDNRFMSSLPGGLSPDLPTPPPPPYPSSAPQVMSPPPMITITDETLNGDDRILFADFEHCPSKDNGTLNYFSYGNGTACSARSTDAWQNAAVTSTAGMPMSHPFQSWPTNALASQSSDKKVQQFAQSASPNRGTDSFKGTAHPVRPHTDPSRSSATKLPATDASNGDKQKAVPLIQPSGQYPSGITSGHSASPLSTQSHPTPCSTSQSSPPGGALPSVSLCDVVYHPEFIVSGPSMFYNEPQSLDSMFFNLSQVSRQQQQYNNGQQPQQNFVLQQNCQQFGTTPVSGNITMYTIPSVQQQQQQPVILPTSNMVLMQTNTTTATSMPGITGQQQLQQQQEHQLYQEALLQSMNSQWNSNQQPPHPGAAGQMPVSQQQQHQLIQQLMNSKQPMTPSTPNMLLTAEDLLLYGLQTSDGRSPTANTGCGGGDPLRETLFNASMYLGDSFDAADMFTAEEFLTLGLDPLELDEIQMLSDASAVTDPATENSFRLDRI